MKKHPVAWLAIAVVVSLAWNRPIPAVAQPTFPPKPQIEQLSSTQDEIRLQVTLPAPALVEKQIDGRYYTSFQFGSYAASSQTGLPELPVLRRTVRIPLGARPSLTFSVQRSETLRLAEAGLDEPVCPGQPAEVKCGGVGDPTQPDPAVYAEDAFYPAEPARIAGEYTERGWRLLELEFWPVQYNPRSGELRRILSLEARIGLPGADWAASQAYAGRFERTDAGLGGAETLNPNLGEPEQKGTKGGPDFLIVAADELAGALAPLVTLKQSQGYSVSVVTRTQAGGSREAIFNYIRTRDPLPVYLLLVGDTNLLPTWTGEVTALGRATVATDLYYTTLDGPDDYVPDIYRGRLPARDVTQLQAMIANLETFNGVSPADAWTQRLTFAATSDSYWDEFVQATHEYVINQHTAPRGFLGAFPVNPIPGGDKVYAILYPTNGATLRERIAQGRGMVIYSGHGNEASWSGPGLTQTDLANYTPPGVLSFAAGFACLTNQFDATTAFGEAWMRQANRGAVNYLGASNYSFWGQDDVLERALFDRLFDPLNPNPSIGEALDAALRQVQMTYPGTSQAQAKYYWEIYNLLGDPSVHLVTEAAPDFTLSTTQDQAELCAGQAAEVTVQAASLANFQEPVTLSAVGLPEGVTARFSNSRLTPPGSVTLRLEADARAEGSYSLATVEGSAAGLLHTAELNVQVAPLPGGAISPQSPPQGAEAQSVRPLFRWSGSSGASSYRLLVAEDALFRQVVSNTGGLTGGEYWPASSLETNRRYYWRVRAENGCGVSEWSETFTFMTDETTDLFRQAVYLPAVGR
jgi:hypothetical protein